MFCHGGRANIFLLCRAGLIRTQRCTASPLVFPWKPRFPWCHCRMWKGMVCTSGDINGDIWRFNQYGSWQVDTLQVLSEICFVPDSGRFLIYHTGHA